MRWTKHIRNGTWLKAHPVVEVFLVTLATSILCFVNPYTRMGGTELVYNLFAECRPGQTHSGLCIIDPPTQAAPVIGAIAVALIVKAALTIVTFGIKLPAGIFIPSLGGPPHILQLISTPRLYESNSWGMRWTHSRHIRAVDAVQIP